MFNEGMVAVLSRSNEDFVMVSWYTKDVGASYAFTELSGSAQSFIRFCSKAYLSSTWVREWKIQSYVSIIFNELISALNECNFRLW